jgi:peroxin-10
MGNQTLGEEYCDILQVRKNRAPYAKVRLLLVLLHVGVPYTLSRLYEYLTSLSNSRTHPRKALISNYFPALSAFLKKYSPQIKETITTVQKIHLAIFYFSGTFYEFSKRILNINYVIL